MINCKNKNGLPMKWVDMNLFHRGQYEYNYSHIGIGCHNLELFVRFYSANSSHLYQTYQQLDTVHHTPNHHRHYPICEPEKQASARCLSSPVSEIPLAAGSHVKTHGTDAHQIVLSCRYCLDGYGRYHFSPHRSKFRWRWDAIRSTAFHVVHCWELNLVVLTLRARPPWGSYNDLPD